MTRLAIIEDHAMVASALAMLVEATDGLEVGLQSEKLSPDEIQAASIDIVLLDLDLHGSGPDPVDVAQLTDAGIRVLIVSALAERASLLCLAHLNLSGVVPKTAPPVELIQAIDVARRGEVWMPREVIDWLTPQDRGFSAEFTQRQLEVLELYASGLKLSTVAKRLGISVNTANHHLKTVRRKLINQGTPAPTQLDLHIAFERAKAARR